MVETGFTSFNTMVDKANRLLKDIEEAYGWPKERRNQSYAALRRDFPYAIEGGTEQSVHTVLRGQ